MLARASVLVKSCQTIFEWMPVKWGEKDSQKMLVSEWEGGELESAGFLKEDI